MKFVCKTFVLVVVAPRLCMRGFYYGGCVFFCFSHCTKQKHRSNDVQFIYFVVAHALAASPFLGQSLRILCTGKRSLPPLFICQFVCVCIYIYWFCVNFVCHACFVLSCSTSSRSTTCTVTTLLESRLQTTLCSRGLEPSREQRCIRKSAMKVPARLIIWLLPRS